MRLSIDTSGPRSRSRAKGRHHFLQGSLSPERRRGCKFERFMKKPSRFSSSLLTFGLIIALGGLGLADQPAARPADTRATEANITRLTTGVLGHSQFAHHPLDTEL